MLPILNIGPLAVQLPGLLLLIGLWLGLTLAERHSEAHAVNPNDLYNLVLVAIITAVLGARLAYVARFPAIFAQSPLSLISLNPGLLDLWGGAAGVLIATIFYGQRKKLKVWQTLDALTPLLAVIAISRGLSTLASGAAFGAPTDLPWGIQLWGAVRHPSQIYNSIAAAIILILLWPAKLHTHNRQPGVYFLYFLALSSVSHLFLEAFRGDSLLLLNGIRTTQVFAWLMMAACFWGIYRLQNGIRNDSPPV